MKYIKDGWAGGYKFPMVTVSPVHSNIVNIISGLHLLSPVFNDYLCIVPVFCFYFVEINILVINYILGYIFWKPKCEVGWYHWSRWCQTSGEGSCCLSYKGLSLPISTKLNAEWDAVSGYGLLWADLLQCSTIHMLYRYIFTSIIEPHGLTCIF